MFVRRLSCLVILVCVDKQSPGWGTKCEKSCTFVVLIKKKFQLVMCKWWGSGGYPHTHTHNYTREFGFDKSVSERKKSQRGEALQAKRLDCKQTKCEESKSESVFVSSQWMLLSILMKEKVKEEKGDGICQVVVVVVVAGDHRTVATDCSWSTLIILPAVAHTETAIHCQKC